MKFYRRFTMADENKPVKIDLNTLKAIWDSIQKYKKSIIAIVFVIGTIAGYNMDNIDISKYIPGTGNTSGLEPRVVQLEEEVKGLKEGQETTINILKELSKK
jgi:hypothetical protein